MTDQLSLARLLAHHRSNKPDALALSDHNESVTWEELDRRTNRAARALIARGVQLDDMVTIALPNGLDFIESCFACWKAGATPQPVSSRLPRPEIEEIIALAGSKIVIANDDIEIEPETVSYVELRDSQDDDSALPELVTSCWKAPTSGGSTGRPKLILATAPAWCEFETAAGWRITADDVAIMPGPLYHNAPFVTAIAAVTAGAHMVIMPRFDAEAVLANVARHKASWIYLVPTMMGRIWRLEDEIKAQYDVSSLKTVWHLAAPCPAWLKEAWINWLGGDVIWELYAATEGMAGTVITGTEWLAHRGSVGRVFAGEIKILDDDGKEAPPGTIGEVYMRPDPERGETYRYVGAEVESRDGWQTLGDMGHFDEDGFLYLADRRSDMILVGGSNVYPAEIEGVLEEHSEVKSCAVIGLPNDDLGATIHAIIEPGKALAEQDLKEFVATRLVAYKRPRSYEFVDHALRDTAGKVRRSKLREERLKKES
ncbi:bile acid-coenzyme A ligase [Parasphingorhabdus marina DSM 22363]|uniref:Bile acid-coenzyme A ligase n=1 Tax=Parasphingorhabdus marina DSM 22363 TaxID=1123272 RepID=A0A1N6D1K1_9SPHN|nr:AMP-binding protein [Parasphingorhabdus marina]SIN64655.1 bile acid-coenzyme A ligase [Parasphingorhabdus marina DSM 22363]